MDAPVSAAGFVRSEGPHPTAHVLPTDDADRVASSYVDRLTHIAPPLPRSPLEDEADDEGDWDTDLHTDLPVPGGASPSTGPPRRVDVASAEALFLLRSFSDLSRLGQLEKAKRLVEEVVKAERHDVLQRYVPRVIILVVYGISIPWAGAVHACRRYYMVTNRLRHRHFLKAAAQRKAVKQAFRFVQVLPRQYVDTRTYNMLVSVCVAASDLKAAMAAADMLVSTGACVYVSAGVVMMLVATWCTFLLASDWCMR